MWNKIRDIAPSEGQQILAVTQQGVVLGYWVSHENGVCDQSDGVANWKWAFTHWMPVPALPTAEH